MAARSSRTGSRRPTPCSCCTRSASIRPARRLDGPSRRSTRPRAGSTTRTSASSMVRSSRASTAARSRSGPTSARTCSGIVDRLLTDQMADGGWNCEQEHGSTRGSFDSTHQRPRGSARVRARDRCRRRRGRGAAAAARSTCSSGASCIGSRTARSARSAGSLAGFPEALVLHASARARLPPRRRARCRTSGWPRRSTSSSRSATRTVGGRSTARTTTRRSSTSVRPRDSRADGSPSAPSVSCAGPVGRAREAPRQARSRIASSISRVAWCPRGWAPSR